MNAKDRKIRILFVCGGNTCRSPMAAAIANAKHGEVVVAESGGTAVWEDGANKLAVEVVRGRFGIDDLLRHKPRDIDSMGIEGFDLVIAMDRCVADDLAGHRSRIKRLEVWDVCDPYNKGRLAYEKAAEEILREVQRLASRIL